MKQIKIVLIIIIFLGCHQNNTTLESTKLINFSEDNCKVDEAMVNSKKQNTHTIFNGDWISQRYKRLDCGECPESICISWTDQYTLSFDNKTFLYDYYGKTEFEFVNEKSIKFKPPKENIDWENLNQTEKFQFTVKQTSDTTMFLIPLDTFTKNNIFANKENEIHVELDTILFTKLSAKNKVKPKRIGFYSRMSAPYFYLEVDDNRNIFYYGIEYVDKIGGYIGKMEESNYNLILKKFQQIELNSLEEYYQIDISHLPEYGLYIQGTNETYQSEVHGGAEPIELQILKEKLMRIKEEELISDKNVWSKFKCRKFMKENIHELRNGLSEKEFRQTIDNQERNNK